MLSYRIKQQSQSTSSMKAGS